MFIKDKLLINWPESKINYVDHDQLKPPFLAVPELSGSRRKVGAPTHRGAGSCKVVSTSGRAFLPPKSRGEATGFRAVRLLAWLASGKPRRYTGHLSKCNAATAPVSFAVFLCLYQRAQSVCMAGCGAVNKALPNSCPGFVTAKRESRHPFKGGTTSKCNGGHTMPDNRKYPSFPPRFAFMVCSLMTLVTAALFSAFGPGVLPLGVSYV